MIDMHTHLDLYPNALDIIKQVNRINRFTLSVTTSPRAWGATSKVFSSHCNIKVALGLHPEIVTEKYNELELLLSSISQTYFIGEVGLDGSAKCLNSLDIQESVFDSVLKECQRVGGRIISIHSRGAASNVLSILQKYPHCGKPILHWFSGSITELNDAIKLKCFFSINPVMMASKKGSNLISRIPNSVILPESDGPFTTMNGRPTMPWEAMSICSGLSKMWKLSNMDVETILNRNLDNLLDLNTQTHLPL